MVRRSVPIENGGKIRCDACPVLCIIREGRAGACDRYANEGGVLVRVDPLVALEAMLGRAEARLVPFVGAGADDADLSPVGVADEERRSDQPSLPRSGRAEPGRGAAAAGESVAATGSADRSGPAGRQEPATAPPRDGNPLGGPRLFVTGIGAGTTYPDYKPAPFIVAQEVDGVDTVTVVTEGIFSYCGAKLKIDTDRHIGEERAVVRAAGEAVGHVTTGEYGSRMLSLGGVDHLTGGSKKEGRVTCETLLALCNREAVELAIDGGATLVVQSGAAPVIDGVTERLMRVGCGSATIGMFARQWAPHVDEVVVVDDHITGVLSEHQAGRMLGMEPSGIRIRGAKSTPGRYFRVAEPGGGWGGTDIDDPLAIVERFRPDVAKPGLRLLMVSTTGEQHAYYELDETLAPVPAPLPEPLRVSVERVAENCEPSLCSVLFMGGAGGSLRAGVTENPVGLTRSVRRALTRVTCGGAPVYLWPGGGITIMVDVAETPQRAFGYVPTPALVAPIEFTLSLADYVALGGYAEEVRRVEEIEGEIGRRIPRARRPSDPPSG